MFTDEMLDNDTSAHQQRGSHCDADAVLIDLIHGYSTRRFY